MENSKRPENTADIKQKFQEEQKNFNENTQKNEPNLKKVIETEVLDI